MALFCRKASYPTGEDDMHKNKYIRRGKNSMYGNPSLPKASRKGTRILTWRGQGPFYEKVMALLSRGEGEYMDRGRWDSGWWTAINRGAQEEGCWLDSTDIHSADGFEGIPSSGMAATENLGVGEWLPEESQVLGYVFPHISSALFCISGIHLHKSFFFPSFPSNSHTYKHITWAV